MSQISRQLEISSKVISTGIAGYIIARYALGQQQYQTTLPLLGEVRNSTAIGLSMGIASAVYNETKEMINAKTRLSWLPMSENLAEPLVLGAVNLATIKLLKPDISVMDNALMFGIGGVVADMGGQYVESAIVAPLLQKVM